VTASGLGYSVGCVPGLNWPDGPPALLTRVGLGHHNTNRAMVVDGPEFEGRAVAKRRVTGGTR
jgi:hypothetical protein